MSNLTNDEKAKLDTMCPVAQAVGLGTRLGELESDLVLELASLADVATGTNTTKAVTPAGVAQETAKLKVKQLSAAGVDVDATIPCVNNGVAGVMAFVTASGAFAGLLALTTDYTVQATTITCKTDQQLNTLVITYR
jgi:hypothetical protein